MREKTKNKNGKMKKRKLAKWGNGKIWKGKT